MDNEIIKVLKNVKRIRESKGITVIDLANEAGIARSYIFYIESNRKIPTLMVLSKIAKALGVEMKDFFG